MEYNTYRDNLRIIKIPNATDCVNVFSQEFLDSLSSLAHSEHRTPFEGWGLACGWMGLQQCPYFT